jgi:hypothetical protein
VAQQALNWYRQTYADQAPARQQAADQATQVSNAQLKGMDTATQQAQDYADYNKSTFRPLEQGLVSDAEAYDTPQRRMQAAAEAAAGVDSAYSGVQQATERSLGRSGIAPGSTKSMSLMQDASLAQAAAHAGAATTAERNVEQQGVARRMDAASLGRGLPSSQATQQQIATTTGNSSASNAGNALAATTSGNGLMTTGFNTAISGNQSAGNLYNMAGQLDNNASGGLMSGIAGLGSAAGSLGWKPFSDKNLKKNTGRMASTAKALDEVEKTPVEDGWQYDPTKGGPDDGGAKHVGPMAQTVRKTMGEDAAPGGKRIDLVNMNGRMMAAVQELSKKVKQLERKAA